MQFIPSLEIDKMKCFGDVKLYIELLQTKKSPFLGEME